MGFPTEQGGAFTCVSLPHLTLLPCHLSPFATGASVTVGLGGVRSKSVVLQIICVKCPADLAALCGAQMVLDGVVQRNELWC